MPNTEKLFKLKELLDNGVLTTDEYEREKQKLLKASKYSFVSSVGMYISIFIVVIICISIMSSFFNDNSSEKDIKPPVSSSEKSIPDEFSSDFPLDIKAALYDNILNFPELKCEIKNNSSKEISAIKLYFEPRNVYGEKSENIFTTKKLDTDNSILSGETAQLNWQLLDQDIKSGDLYIYSVYFSDGTEWGDKTASESIIKKYGFKLNATY